MRLEAAPRTEPRSDAERYRGTVESYESAGYEKAAEQPGGTTPMAQDPR